MQLKALPGLPQEGNGVACPFHGMGCHVPYSYMPQGKASHTVLVTACQCPTQTPQSFANISFLQKMSNGKEFSLQFPVLLQKWEMNTYIPLLHQRSRLYFPTSMWSVENKGLGQKGSLAALTWGLTNMTGLLAWPQLIPIPALAHLQVSGAP